MAFRNTSRLFLCPLLFIRMWTVDHTLIFMYNSKVNPPVFPQTRSLQRERQLRPLQSPRDNMRRGTTPDTDAREELLKNVPRRAEEEVDCDAGTVVLSRRRTDK